MSKIIEIIVSPKGETKLETKGFSGGNCQEASRAFEAALGKSSGENLTSEYYTEAETNQIDVQN
jgi:hypothetical protein